MFFRTQKQTSHINCKLCARDELETPRGHLHLKDVHDVRKVDGVVRVCAPVQKRVTQDHPKHAAEEMIMIMPNQTISRNVIITKIKAPQYTQAVEHCSLIVRMWLMKSLEVVEHREAHEELAKTRFSKTLAGVSNMLVVVDRAHQRFLIKGDMR